MNVLIIDADDGVAKLFKEALISQGIAKTVDCIHSLEEGVTLANSSATTYDLVLLDLAFPETTAMEAAKQAALLSVPVLIISSLNKDQIEAQVGPLTRPYQHKESALQSGGLLTALTTVVMWFKGGDARTQRIEDKLDKLKQINSKLTNSPG